jgi:hypothetical protein
MTHITTADGIEYLAVFGGATRTPDGSIAPTSQTLLFGPLSVLFNASWSRPVALNNESLPHPAARIGHVATGPPASGIDTTLLVTAGFTFDPITANSSADRDLLQPLPMDDMWVISTPTTDIDTWVWTKRTVAAPVLPAPRGFAASVMVQGHVVMLGGWNGTDVSSLSDGLVWMLAVDTDQNHTAEWLNCPLTGVSLPPVALTSASSYDNVSYYRHCSHFRALFLQYVRLPGCAFLIMGSILLMNGNLAI